MSDVKKVRMGDKERDVPVSDTVVLPARLHVLLEDPKTNGEPSIWETVERLAKILAGVLIPLVGAWVGWLIHVSGTNAEYLKQAVAELSEEDTDPALRAWAVDVFVETSPVPVSCELEQALREGTVSLWARIDEKTLGKVLGHMNRSIATSELPLVNLPLSQWPADSLEKLISSIEAETGSTEIIEAVRAKGDMTMGDALADLINTLESSRDRGVRNEE